MTSPQNGGFYFYPHAAGRRIQRPNGHKQNLIALAAAVWGFLGALGGSHQVPPSWPLSYSAKRGVSAPDGVGDRDGVGR